MGCAAVSNTIVTKSGVVSVRSSGRVRKFRNSLKKSGIDFTQISIPNGLSFIPKGLMPLIPRDLDLYFNYGQDVTVFVWSDPLI